MARIAVIDKGKHFPDKCGWLCPGLCPVNRTGKECIIKGHGKDISIDESLCTGCGICAHRCPFGAISIINLPEELETEPVHRFGENGFALYRLPIPKFGQVVGIMGRNGIGKTTALKILAGLLQPNLGTKKEVSYDELVKKFRGTEAQSYFQKLKEKKVKIAYKPQKVDDIPKQYKGKVISLLKKVDEKCKLDEVSDALGITNILGHDIAKLSGGELQAVAIAATALKDATVYYFDEPSSYLDISQRLRIAKFIKSLINEETAVMVVEHDLIILDYMTDIIHLMYGQAACYGVVSQPLASKVGVNTYLDGYLRSENVRFRDKTIKFMVKSPEARKHHFELTKWPMLIKKLETFKLEVDEGDVKKHEVLGILGRNAIGKTTFVKLLAGVLEPDKGSVDLKLKVSYKPQYISSDSEDIVLNVLQKAVQDYKALIVRPLELEPLFMKKINELSGGELQRVAIALCLSQDSDLFLLDEPSAYLDVEQRLIISKVINDVMENKGASALVVDHDLLFMDYLAHRLLVFEGEPSVKGFVHKPLSMEEGMNKLLKELSISIRREEQTGRPRINKEGSVKDRAQKQEGKYYYS
ncbi:MAG: ribosome biogenesis/translation initiation ATPase RLI [Nanoarchaeota archaeon]|nr:ribosome biogenesis/translation initiation ATPase RLI [Nanoarchaeota archaeon]